MRSKEITKQGDGVGDVDLSIIICVQRLQTIRGATDKEIIQAVDGIGNIEKSIPIGVTPLESRLRQDFRHDLTISELHLESEQGPDGGCNVRDSACHR